MRSLWIRWRNHGDGDFSAQPVVAAFEAGMGKRNIG